MNRSHAPSASFAAALEARRRLPSRLPCSSRSAAEKHGHAAPALDPSGHWEGAIHAPSQDVAISVDLALGRDGKLVGTRAIRATTSRAIRSPTRR